MKLFRKLTVLALAVLLVCSLSAAAFAANSHTHEEVYDDSNRIISHVSISTDRIYGEINNWIEMPMSGDFNMTFIYNVLNAATGTTTVGLVYYDEGHDTSGLYTQFNSPSSTSLFSQVNCQFHATVTNYIGDYYYDYTSGVIYP